MFKTNIQKTTATYKAKENTKKRELADNRAKQQRLREELASLEQREQQLDNEIRAGESQDGAVEQEKEKAILSVEAWKEKVEELQRRSETALKVMEEMRGQL